MVRRLLREIEARLGPPRAWRVHARALLPPPALATILAELERRWPSDPADAPPDRPIFLLCAGWRSGSTLLQRLVVSSGEALVWGEPFALSGLTQRLAESLLALPPGYPPDRFFLGERPGPLHESFIANLYPHVRHLREAHREFFRTLFAHPAREAGYARWGIKEVRLRVEHAHYLRWLFPGAKIVFLYRDPYDCYRSYRRFRDWYYAYPGDPVLTPRRFGEIWVDSVRGYLADAARLDAFVVRYEDLCSGRLPLEDLEAHVGVLFSREVLGKRLRGLPDGSEAGKPSPPSAAETNILRRTVDPLARELGYLARPR